MLSMRHRAECLSPQPGPGADRPIGYEAAENAFDPQWRLLRRKIANP